MDFFGHLGFSLSWSERNQVGIQETVPHKHLLVFTISQCPGIRIIDKVPALRAQNVLVEIGNIKADMKTIILL